MNDAIIVGKSGKKYLFEHSAITTTHTAKAPAVYIFVRRVKDNRVNPPEKYYAAFDAFGIEKPTEFNQLKTSELATGFLCHLCNDKDEVNTILDDLEEKNKLVITDVV